jgi:hypothetical protein
VSDTKVLTRYEVVPYEEPEGGISWAVRRVTCYGGFYGYRRDLLVEHIYDARAEAYRVRAALAAQARRTA